tara:strand:- start:443 stop:652 length:210 start_codon:yes stop_codon:yes gene_type:complete
MKNENIAIISIITPFFLWFIWALYYHTRRDNPNQFITSTLSNISSANISELSLSSNNSETSSNNCQEKI